MNAKNPLSEYIDPPKHPVYDYVYETLHCFGDKIANCCGLYLFQITKPQKRTAIIAALKDAFNLAYKYHRGFFVTTMNIDRYISSLPELQVGEWYKIKTKNGTVRLNVLTTWPDAAVENKLPNDFWVTSIDPVYGYMTQKKNLETPLPNKYLEGEAEWH